MNCFKNYTFLVNVANDTKKKYHINEIMCMFFDLVSKDGMNVIEKSTGSESEIAKIYKIILLELFLRKRLLMSQLKKSIT